jgi:hypothetical protein
MPLLQASVDISVIALWLGQESPIHRYRAPDSLLDFLKTL